MLWSPLIWVQFQVCCLPLACCGVIYLGLTTLLRTDAKLITWYTGRGQIGADWHSPCSILGNLDSPRKLPFDMWPQERDSCLSFQILQIGNYCKLDREVLGILLEKIITQKQLLILHFQLSYPKTVGGGEGGFHQLLMTSYKWRHQKMPRKAAAKGSWDIGLFAKGCSSSADWSTQLDRSERPSGPPKRLPRRKRPEETAGRAFLEEAEGGGRLRCPHATQPRPARPSPCKPARPRRHRLAQRQDRERDGWGEATAGCPQCGTRPV